MTNGCHHFGGTSAMCDRDQMEEPPRVHRRAVRDEDADHHNDCHAGECPHCGGENSGHAGPHVAEGGHLLFHGRKFVSRKTSADSASFLTILFTPCLRQRGKGCMLTPSARAGQRKTGRVLQQGRISVYVARSINQSEMRPSSMIRRAAAAMLSAPTTAEITTIRTKRPTIPTIWGIWGLSS